MMLRIDRLRKVLGARVLFDLEAFALDAGRAYVLTGINGAGKSTLLRVLAGLEPGEASGVTWQGQPLAFSPYPQALRAAIVYVHQHPVLFSTSVADNIGYGLRARGVARAQAAPAVAQAMAWAGVEHLRGSDPARLSGGEVQRVALARAWVLRPALLLLDEPTANLDGPAREQLIALIPALLAAGSTVVMACHDRDLIGMPGVQRLKLRDGKLETK
ncbi:energy-coupling factor ABC transporter ATP-binding protein [Massilia atriviolacea]|uniref:Energy-coupling factor ABC transporter ATP-binding protein n=1 Tax=Massilia atriviolacea TaxID=2495579 RepID=A0A430HEQ3_9BURK|nr:energy-coupling factor ABC transporter ATP-binding protein [Massilia atriviolacea]RSZ55996.1 energy-coupling factor ABC transporter ATP-binding protein [Massilia atriviolacea]